MTIKNEPITESYYYILLCLYRGAKHGYGIMQETLILTKGKVRIGSGTMYGATSNMMKKGWIIERKSDNPEDDRKRMYELTTVGRQVLENEIERLKKLLESAEQVMEKEDNYE